MDKMYHRIQLARLALFLSMASLAAVFLTPVVLTSILAPAAILLAIISKGQEDRMSSRARRACVLAGIALVLNLVVIILSFSQLALIMADPVRRRQFDELLYSSYGYRLEDILAPYRQLLGL